MRFSWFLHDVMYWISPWMSVEWQFQHFSGSLLRSHEDLFLPHRHERMSIEYANNSGWWGMLREMCWGVGLRLETSFPSSFMLTICRKDDGTTAGLHWSQPFTFHNHVLLSRRWTSRVLKWGGDCSCCRFIIRFEFEPAVSRQPWEISSLYLSRITFKTEFSPQLLSSSFPSSLSLASVSSLNSLCRLYWCKNHIILSLHWLALPRGTPTIYCADRAV